MIIDVQPRWREELVATCEQGTLIFELTMGTLHLYFPDEDLWQRSVPEWAQPLYDDFLRACRDWCIRQGIPMEVTSHTLVYARRQGDTP